MPAEVNSKEPSLASLVSGIIADAQELIKQQFALLLREFQQELKQAKAAAVSLSVGVAVTAVGGLLLILMLVYLLKEYTTLPLWGCFGIVGGTLTAIGAVLLIVGKKEASAVDIVLPPKTSETLKENWEWLKSPTTAPTTAAVRD